MITLNIQDQVKSWTGDYIDFVHFEENSSFNMENTLQNESVTINIIYSKKMVNINTGIAFMCEQLQQKEFMNIKELELNIKSYSSNDTISSFQGLGNILIRLEKLGKFCLNLHQHHLSKDQITDFLISTLDCKKLVDCLIVIKKYYKNDNYFKFTFDHQNQILNMHTSDLSAKTINQILSYIIDQKNLKQLKLKTEISSNCRYENCKILNSNLAIQSLLENNLDKLKSQNLYLLDSDQPGLVWCSCQSHESPQKLKNQIMKKLLKLVIFNL